jgi:hypothetical protein
MEEKILKYRKQIIGTIALGLVFAISIGFILPFPEAEAQTDQVNVTAAVNAWLTFSTGTTLNLGDLVTASGGTNLGTDSVALNVGTNNRDGWSIEMVGGNDCATPTTYGSCETDMSYLYGSSAEFGIPSVSARITLAAGNEDLYGALVEPLITDWSGIETPNGEPTIAEAGNDTEGSESGYYWEEISGTGESASGGAGPIPYGTGADIVSADLPHSETVVANFHIRATATDMTPSDSYTDTITLTATGGV